jgi:Helix-turn-helix domain
VSVDLVMVDDRQPGRWAASSFPGRRLHSRDEVRAALGRARGRRPTVWIARRASQLSPLAAEGRLPRGDHRLLLLQEAEGAQRDFLHVVFRVVVAPGSGVALLPTDELMEALAAPHRADLFVGGLVAPADEAVVLFRGTLEPLVVPFTWFRRREAAPEPDFAAFAVGDYGQTVRFGAYEASSDVVLYAHDAAYRRRARERRLREDASFGASLRRLRLLKGVSRDAFPGVSEKQVARIERGEIRRPRRATVEALAARLGVAPSEIASY